jgi:NADH-quinone oxidoreductase subunit L
MDIGLLILLIPLLPFAGFLINGLFHNSMPKNAAAAISCLAVLGSFLCSLYLFSHFISNGSQPITYDAFSWINVGQLQVPFSFLIDQLTLCMLMVVTGVGFLIHVYSAGYMSHDPGLAKFFSYLNLFMFSMLLLVMGSNYLIMFVGWEGVGLCSYLLIGFWNKNTEYNNAAKKAFIMNRIGDLGFLLGIFLIFITFGSISFNEVFTGSETFGVNEPVIICITLLLFVGAVGKSAQLPLYTWLPDAMAGPTPVSALIHAATMVTAGIYMIVRSNVLYTLAPVTLEVVGIIGLTTALFAATIGLFQNDIKKVLAYSTVSQLGFMFLALGMGAYGTAMFHLITHAFFKALLFLGAGSVIHAMGGEQDIRKMGGLKKALPLTFITFLIATLAISGIPPFAGFFSKDEILANVFIHNKLMYALALVASMMTAFYMFRLLYLTFFRSFRGTEDQKHHLHESPYVMTIPLILLAVLSAIGGFMGVPEVFGMKHMLAEFLAPVIVKGPGSEGGHALSHRLELILMAISVLAAIAAIVVAYIIYISRSAVPATDEAQIGAVQKTVYNKYYVDELYDVAIVKPLNKFSELLYNVGEFLVIDLVVNTVGKMILYTGKTVRVIQNGSVGFYVFAMVISIAVIMLVNLFLQGK